MTLLFKINAYLGWMGSYPSIPIPSIFCFILSGFRTFFDRI
nr:MAG TPA: hypothetical protein [Caudoviricetes sp.]